jgi:hypothetical protein
MVEGTNPVQTAVRCCNRRPQRSTSAGALLRQRHRRKILTNSAGQPAIVINGRLPRYCHIEHRRRERSIQTQALTLARLNSCRPE